MASDALRDLIEHSMNVGVDLDLVQASGGNTSWKSTGTVWVKGSGKCLKDANSQQIFAQINFGELSQNQIISCLDFTPYTIGTITPSIEANFHILIDNPFVTHLHSLAAIALGSMKLSSNDISELCERNNISILPYVRPGVDLAREIIDVQDCQKRILLLESHGVIFSAENTFDLEFKIRNFEKEVLNFIELIPTNENLPNWIDILTQGVLTPDEAVFLGETPFVKSESPIQNLINIKSDGCVNFPEGISQDRKDLALFYVRVAKLIEKKAEINYLTDAEVTSLLRWDKEKLRIAMAK